MYAKPSRTWPGFRSAGTVTWRRATSSLVRTSTTSAKLTALMKKLGAVPKAAIRSPLITGPTIRPDEITALFRATALGKSASPTRSLTKLSSAGLSMDMISPSSRAASQIIQSRIRSVHHQQPDCGRQHRQGALRHHQQAAAVEPVGNDAAIEAEKHERPELKRVGDSKRQAGIGQLQDQPVLGGDLDPGADVGSDLRREIDPEIAIPQADECCGKTMRQDSTVLLFRTRSRLGRVAGAIRSRSAPPLLTASCQENQGRADTP